MVKAFNLSAAGYRATGTGPVHAIEYAIARLNLIG
jgi:hypothetical protein